MQHIHASEVNKHWKFQIMEMERNISANNISLLFNNNMNDIKQHFHIYNKELRSKTKLKQISRNFNYIRTPREFIEIESNTNFEVGNK